MRITIQFFDGCPHWELAEQRLRHAIKDLGREDIEVSFQHIVSHEDAQRLGFHGSPTLLFNGRDVFAKRDLPVAFGCRIYETEAGAQGAPSVAQLRHVLRSAPSDP